jgi:hypothetical protein
MLFKPLRFVDQNFLLGAVVVPLLLLLLLLELLLVEELLLLDELLVFELELLFPNKSLKAFPASEPRARLFEFLVGL